MVLPTMWAENACRAAAYCEACWLSLVDRQRPRALGAVAEARETLERMEAREAAWSSRKVSGDGRRLRSLRLRIASTSCATRLLRLG